MEIVNDNLNSNKTVEFRPWGMEENQFCMFMHLSQLASYIIPVAGMILPIIMWATNKEQSKLVDLHGKNILNWMISSYIYIFISTILAFLLIGIPLLIVIGICTLIFAIIGAIKANDGIVYKYPFSITIFR